MPTPAFARSLTRRSAFRLTAGATLTTVGLLTTTSCSDEEDPDRIIDALTPHLRRAERDAAAAGAAIATLPDLAVALDTVRSERTEHADALRAEIDRVAGTSGESGATTTTTTEAAPPPTLDELTTSLTESQRGASDSAREQSGYRAGLLGSISASCAVHVGVLLS